MIADGRTAPEWRRPESANEQTAPIDLAELAKLLSEARDAAEAARSEAHGAREAVTAASKRPAGAQKGSRSATGPQHRSAAQVWSTASVLIVLIVALAVVAVALAYLHVFGVFGG
jgi:hypothetical protein